jgi:dCMP deaminase
MKAPINPRPDWDTYFLDITQVVKRRSNCRRRQVAALIVKDRRIISTGYNGTPSGIRNCNEGGCPRCAGAARPGEELGDCICAHAEENAIVQAAYHGVAIKDAVLYCTDSPCLLCAKLIIAAGIKEVIYEQTYCRSRQVASLFREAGVRCRRFIRKSRAHRASG